MRPLSIGTVAREAGVGVETLRFYEREGLIENPPRRRSGYRQYPPETVDRVRFIRRAKDVGFSLREIRELLDLRLSPGATAADIRKRALAKIDDIGAKIRSLQRMKRTLRRLTSACRGRGPLHACPILEALEGRGKR